MSVVALQVSNVLDIARNRNGATPIPYEYNLRKSFSFPLSLEHTYLLIFAKYQHNGIETLKQWENINILYQSPPCQNSWHPGSSANIIVVFEFKELPK